MNEVGVLCRLDEIAEPGSVGFLSFERKHILCATHGALFRIDDGHCFQGPCVGKSLIPVAIKIEGENIVLVD